MITGRIIKVDGGTIMVKIIHGFTLLKHVNKTKKLDGLKLVESESTRLFDLEFQTNRTVSDVRRTPYLLQHNALYWLKKHNLFEILIGNPKYEEEADAASDADNNKSR